MSNAYGQRLDNKKVRGNNMGIALPCHSNLDVRYKYYFLVGSNSVDCDWL